MQIGVIGGGEAKGQIYAIAKEVGREIAKSGAILICGGLGGVMEACAKGAKEAGGITVGILPGFNSHEANPYIDIKIPTAMSHARNAIIARSADVLIAIDGSLGTISEIALGLKVGKPVIVLENTIPNVTSIFKDILIAKNPIEAVELAYKVTGKNFNK
jgi:hypothetical protein